MSTFSFDTSGVVYVGSDHRVPGGHVEWSDLSPFVQGYVEALFASVGELIPRWNSMDERTELERPAFSDLDPSALALILRDCEHDVRMGERIGSGEDRTSRDAGRKFWLERQTGNLFDCPPLQPYLSEAGKVCLREAA